MSQTTYAPDVRNASAQVPTLESLPPAQSTAGDDVIDFASSCGLELDEWQKHVLRGGLRENGSRWSAFEVAYTVPRQNGKGTVLEARELAELLLFGGRLVVHTAHLLSTSEEARTRMEQIIEGSAYLTARVKRVVRSNGKEAIEFKNGGRLKYVARSKGGGRGWTGSLIVFDEDMFLSSQSMAALVPTLATAELPQLWYAGSAGLAESDHKRALRDRALAGNDPHLAYMEWAAPTTADLDDRAMWLRANPGAPHRISLEFIAQERATLTDEDFARERCGIWQRPNGDQVISDADWRSCADPTSQATDEMALALEVAPMDAGAAIAVASRRPDGRSHIEIIDIGAGSAWVAPRVAALVAKWSANRREVTLDPAGPAGHLVADLERLGVRVRAVTPREVGQACARFYTEAIGHQLRHLDDRSLNVALGAARKRPLGDAWVWHRRDVADISPLVAATLALDALVRGESAPKPPPMFVPRRLM